MSEFVHGTLLPQLKADFEGKGFLSNVTQKLVYVNKEVTNIELGNDVYILANAKLGLLDTTKIHFQSPTNFFSTNKDYFLTLNFGKNQIFTDRLEIKCPNYEVKAGSTDKRFIEFVLEFVIISPYKK